MMTGKDDENTNILTTQSKPSDDFKRPRGRPKKTEPATSMTQEEKKAARRAFLQSGKRT